MIKAPCASPAAHSCQTSAGRPRGPSPRPRTAHVAPEALGMQSPLASDLIRGVHCHVQCWSYRCIKLLWLLACFATKHMRRVCLPKQEESFPCLSRCSPAALIHPGWRMTLPSSGSLASRRAPRSGSKEKLKKPCESKMPWVVGVDLAFLKAEENHFPCAPSVLHAGQEAERRNAEEAGSHRAAQPIASAWAAYPAASAVVWLAR